MKRWTRKSITFRCKAEANQWRSKENKKDVPDVRDLHFRRGYFEPEDDGSLFVMMMWRHLARSTCSGHEWSCATRLEVDSLHILQKQNRSFKLCTYNLWIILSQPLFFVECVGHMQLDFTLPTPQSPMQLRV